MFLGPNVRSAVSIGKYVKNSNLELLQTQSGQIFLK